MADVQKLRDGLTADQRTLLDAIWMHCLSAGGGENWPLARTIHLSFGKDGKERVQGAAAGLPPGAVFRTPEPEPRYGLSALGLLLMTEGAKVGVKPILSWQTRRLMLNIHAAFC
ncbi:MAG: hypothetical protein HZC42_07120 [Candidatus Eisenbacteria bacterium]|nr:hypothetical protein [Candidatus Eisenbacteria bacterium]